MEYELTILTTEKAEQEIATFLADKHYKMEYGGYKRLAYPIGGNDYAHYYYLNLNLSKFETGLLEKGLISKDWALRYLLVKKDTQRQHRLIYRTIEKWADSQSVAVSEEQVELLTHQIETELSNGN